MAFEETCGLHPSSAKAEHSLKPTNDLMLLAWLALI